MGLLIYVLALSAALFYGAAQGDEAKHDEERLHGTWTVVEWTEDLEDKSSEFQSMSFVAGKLTVKPKVRKDVQGTYQLIDETSKPPTIRIKLIQDIKGIYQLENESLKLCLASPRQDPPTEFKATPNWTLIVLKREKR